MNPLLERLFPDGALRASCPWPQAGRLKRVHDYDHDVVARLLARPPGEDLEEVDPVDLRATQPSVTRAGVAYYLDDGYARTGTTYADQHSAANRVPVVYRRDDGESLILTGHHRSSAALLQGGPVLARVARGGFGASRDEPLVRPVVARSGPTRPLHVTPGLALGGAASVDHAVAAVLAGHRAAVPDETAATEVLRRLGCTPEQAADRLRFAATGRV